VTATLIEHEYRARGAARALFRCHAPEVLIEGPAGTGKTRCVLEKINWLCEEFAGVRVLIARATRTSMTESVLVTLETKVFWEGHEAMAGSEASRENRHAYTYPNGSVIVVGSLDHPDRLFSTEWDAVYVAECTEITEDAWEKFARAMRNRRIPKGVSGGPQKLGERQAIERDEETGIEGPAFFTQRIADCNPGPPNHWLNLRPERVGSQMVRLRSRHRDNPSMTAGELAGLRALTGHRRARLYEGRWAAGEGSVYPEFTDRHVIAPFDIPADWPWYVGIDPGYDHPCAILWFTVAPNKCLYVADELYRGGLAVAEHARDIRARNAGRTVHRYYGDPQHAFSRTAQSPKSIAMQFGENGIRVGPWPRTAGSEETMVEAVRELLRQNMLKVFSTCPHTIGEFQSWSYKRTVKGELPPGEDKFEDANNHAMDVVRGVVATRPKHRPGKIEVHGGA
jgi:hypothetical protein